MTKQFKNIFNGDVAIYDSFMSLYYVEGKEHLPLNLYDLKTPTWEPYYYGSLTNEERAKVFAMYVPCKIINGITDDLKQRNLTYDNIDTYAYCKISDPKMVLKPLSTITDNHALQLGSIFHDDYLWSIIYRSQNHILIGCDDYKLWLWFSEQELIDCEEIYTGEENIEAHGGETSSCSCYHIVDMIDYLREQGYALPYKGHSLFELGIAIEDKLINETP